MGSNVRTIPLGDISESPDNYRKTFDPGEMGSLTNSVRTFGVMQDITVRPNPAAKGKYIVTDGARRYRAAVAAKLTELQCKVEDIDDKQARVEMVILNEQRAEVPLLEKVAGYQRLIDDGKTLDQAATIAGKGVGSMRALLKLTRLPELARTALAKGIMPESMAVMIAAQATDDMRKKVSNWIFDDWDGQEPFDPDIFLPSVREVKDFIVRELRVELKQAPFDQSDKLLVPDAGSCKACPKRAGNNKEECGDMRADTCLDPTCYRAKCAAWHRQEDAKREAQVGSILPASESAKLFPAGNYLSSSCPYWNMNDPNFLLEGPKHAEPWHKLLNGHVSAADLVGARDGNGDLQILVRKDFARAMLKAHHGYKPTERDKEDKETGKLRKKWAEEEKQRNDERHAVINSMGKRLKNGTVAAYIPARTAEALRVVILDQVGRGIEGGTIRLLERLGYTDTLGVDTYQTITQWVENQDFAGLIIFLAEIAAVNRLWGSHRTDAKEAVETWFKGPPPEPAKRGPGRPKKVVAHGSPRSAAKKVGAK